MELVYRSLVRDTLIPSDPRVVAEAALAAMSAGSQLLPPGFGQDIGSDGARLAAHLPGDGRLWAVLEAMGRAADKPHTGLMDPVRGAGLGALQTGRPRVTPGFGLARQPDGGLAVVDVAQGGSAESSGLEAGDLIVAIDGVPPRASGLEVLRFYSAPVGRRFTLSIERADEQIELDLVLEPGEVSGVTWRRLGDGVSYVNIRWFATSDDPQFDTATLVRCALSDLAPTEDRGLVVDLRFGMGGSLRAVREIISMLTGADEAVAFRDKDGELQQYPRVGDQVTYAAPIAVLVNEQSTSAAEFLAVGLEELASAQLVGTPTSGGLNILTLVPLTDEYQLVLPGAAGLGPRSLATRPGHRLEPTALVPNPTPEDIVAGRDAQLEAARLRVLREHTD